jgi:[acyl-carrier-protein] S-malonyltransferase
MAPDPARTAFIFPGQGSQAVGLGQALAQAEPKAAAVFQQADASLGFALSTLCWEGPEEALNATENTQPALLTHSVAVWTVFKDRFPEFNPAALAGHSLGEFSALVAAGAVTFADGLRLVRARGEAMKAAGQDQPGGMAAVLGLETGQVRQICEQATEQASGGVWVANDNCPGQVVISGDNQALAIASEMCSQSGARKVMRLAVSIAAHSPFMAAAQTRFASALDATPLQDPIAPVYANVTAAPLRTAQEIGVDLKAQLTANVRWTESIQAMAAAGVGSFIEMGSGKVLTGLIRRIDSSLERLNLDEPESFATLTA